MRSQYQSYAVLFFMGVIVLAIAACGSQPPPTPEQVIPTQEPVEKQPTQAPVLMGGYQGLVMDSNTYNGVGGAQITFISEDGSFRQDAVSDPDGTYQVPLPTGRYRVSAIHNDYQPFDSGGFFAVPEGKFYTGNIMLAPKAAPQNNGGTQMGGFQGIVYDSPQGFKIPAVQITFVSEDGTVTQVVTSDANGVYQVDLPQGRYHVSAVHNDYELFQPDGFFVVPGPGYQIGDIAMIPKAQPPAPPDNSASGAVNLAGAFWYFGAENVSCDEVCTSHGGYNEATRTYAGSDGTAENCQAVLQALQLPIQDFYPTKQGGLGCFTIQLVSGDYGGFWDQHPTTSSATYQVPGRRRICGCNQ